MKEPAPPSPPTPHSGGHAPSVRVTDLRWWPLVAALALRWRWLGWGAALCAGLGFLTGRALWSTRFTAVAQLIRHETPDPMLFQPRAIAPPTLASMIESAEVRARVGAAAQPPLSAAAVAGLLRIVPERGSDILNITIAGDRPAAAAGLANRYAAEAVRFTQELQSREAADAARYLAAQLAKVEDDISRLNQQLRLVAPAAARPPGAPRPPGVLIKLEEARDQLADSLLRYTDAHPLVQEQRARVAALERQLDELAKRHGGGVRSTARSHEPAPAPAPVPSAQGDSDYEGLREVSRALENQRLTLVSRLRLTQMLQSSPPGYYRLFAPANTEHAVARPPSGKVLFLTVLAGLAGIVAAGAAVAAAELLDPRLRTGADVQRVARLPVLARLGDMAHMTPAEQARWAFRTWTALQHRLAGSPNLGLVCGVTSSTAGEGRSLWIRLLSDAANQCGFRVLTIATQPSPAGADLPRADALELPADPSPPAAGTAAATEGRGDTLSTNVLAAPAAISEQLSDPNGPPLVHIPLPGWVWSLERRKEWRAALEHWRGIDNLVILVELPPADVPEAVLLAQNLPNLLWLADCTRATAPATCVQLNTLHHARCHLVGAVLNREPRALGLERFARWVPTLAAAGLLALGVPPLAGQPAAPTALSVSSPAHRAEWQKKLTLGPGDVLRLSLYGEPALTQPELAVQPDGRISFLEARDLMAAGLTIDELRARLDAELALYRRAPRTMVTPLSFHSKKYYMLGKVMQKGVFTLDRPLTVVEAVARARGFETGLSGRNLVELVDLSRSLLVRRGVRAPLDFERLFAAGDLSQNIPVEPGDYFYFPAADVAEVYLLGEVAAPGPVPCPAGLTAAAAIASRGGLTPRAWRQRALVVRGSLHQPQTFVVDLPAVLGARQPDFGLQPRDIVYVHARPWIRAEELLDAAATAFAQSVVVFWTTDQVIPVVR